MQAAAGKHCIRHPVIGRQPWTSDVWITRLGTASSSIEDSEQDGIIFDGIESDGVDGLESDDGGGVESDGVDGIESDDGGGVERGVWAAWSSGVMSPVRIGTIGM